MKSLKKILSVILLACMLVGVLALTGCKEEEPPVTPGDGGGSDGDSGYVVTVVDTDGKPIAGVKLMLTNSKDVLHNYETDSDGKVSADITGEGLGVVIVNPTSGYIKPEAVSGLFHAVFAEGSKQVTITLEKEASMTKTAYTITIKDQNGEAVEGVTLQLCYGGSCYPTPATDKNGKTTIELADPSGVNLKILSVPSGYKKPEATINGEYHLTIADGVTTAEFVIEKN